MPSVPPEHTPHARLRKALHRHHASTRAMMEAAQELQDAKDQARAELRELIAAETDPNGPPVENQGPAA